MDVTSRTSCKEEEEELHYPDVHPTIDTHALCKIDICIYASHLSIMRGYSRSKTRTDVECSSSLKHRWQSDCGPKAHICGFEGKRGLA